LHLKKLLYQCINAHQQQLLFELQKHHFFQFFLNRKQVDVLQYLFDQLVGVLKPDLICLLNFSA